VKELISALGGLRHLLVQLPSYDDASVGPVAGELGE
jgi:hypothetical protein